MGNYLKMADKQRILALLELGWSYRRIAREAGVHRDTVARYDPRRTAKPANVSAGSMSACEPFRDIIERAPAQGLTAQRIWQDLRTDYCPSHEYASVKRYVRLLKKRRPEVAGVIWARARRCPSTPCLTVAYIIAGVWLTATVRIPSATLRITASRWNLYHSHRS